MVPVTKTFWLEHVRAWKASELSCRDYAEQTGLNFRTLAWYGSRLKAELDAKPATNGTNRIASGFIEILPAQRRNTAEPIELLLRNVSIRLPPNFDEHALVRVLDILEARS
jgi:hypothetical protein